MCDSFLTSAVTLVDALKGKLSQRSYLWSTSKLDFSSSKQEKVNVLVISTCVDDTMQGGAGISSPGWGDQNHMQKTYKKESSTEAKDLEN